MDSPVRKMQKKNDYNRHKLLRKIKRRRKAAAEQQSKAAEKELRRKLKMPKFGDGKSQFGDISRAYWGVGNNPVDVGELRHHGYNDNMIWQKIKNSAYYDAGTLPEVYIRPNNDNAVHHAKEMFPDKNFRNSFLRYMDDSREDLNISQRDSVQRLYNIYSQSKFPTLHVLKGDGRSWYYPTNDMFIYDEDPDAYVSELAHAYQYNAKHKYKINILDGFRPKNWGFEELFGRRDRYNNPGTIEYNAHHIIEPAIWDYVEGYQKNINLNR